MSGQLTWVDLTATGGAGAGTSGTLTADGSLLDQLIFN